MSDMEDFIDVKVTRRGREVAGRLLQVAGDDQSRRTQFGAHRSFSMGYDDLAYPSLRRAANIEAFWTCVKLFGLLQNCSSKRDVPTSPFEAHGQQELPLAGTHSQQDRQSFCAGPSPCTRAREMLTSTATRVRDETKIGNLRHSVIQGHPHFSLHSHHRRASVANAGASGDTAAMGLARFNRSITDDTDAVILELGANAMLRGFELKRAALAAIVRDLEARRTAL
jgi:hypothetical protein